MGKVACFITHPNVVISKNVPVTRWPLSELGRTRMLKFLSHPWVANIASIYSSTEQKSIDCASILAEHLSLPFVRVQELGENDRSSTGFLPPEEFELVANEFFAKPEVSVRGWERAIDAQQRVVSAVEQLLANDHAAGIAAIVSHGAVGTLLYCALTARAIDRKWDQPPNGGGNYFLFSLAPRDVCSWWRPIDEAPATLRDS
jgi:broad specificity phosphatase PhoE